MQTSNGVYVSSLLCAVLLGMANGQCSYYSYYHDTSPQHLHAVPYHEYQPKEKEIYQEFASNSSRFGIYCAWMIDADPGYVVQLKLIAVVMSSRCSINVFDITSDSARIRMHSVCHGPVPGDTLLSSGRHMRIEFVSSPFLQSMIHFTYRAVYPGGIHCTAESRTLQALQADGAMENTHSLTYETWPGSYENNLHCAWLITTTHRGHVIKLQVVDMDVEFRFGCWADNVTIYDGSVPSSSKVLARLCGHTLETMYSNDQAMHIVFQTDSSVAKRGFLLRYSSVVPENHETYSPYRPHRRTPTTTTSTTSHRISSTTRKSYKSHEKQPHDVGAIVGGVTAGILGIVLLCACCCCCCCNRKRLDARDRGRAARLSSPSPTTTTTTTTPNATRPVLPGSRTVYNNSTVFMMTSPASASSQALYFPGAFATAESGATNPAFSSDRDAPPSYFSLQHSLSSSLSQSGAVLSAPPPDAGAPPPDAGAPPSYAEATRLAQPPADPSATGDRAEHDLRHQVLTSTV